MDTADRMFMNKAAQDGMAEIQLGQLAVQKGSSQSVKDFGGRMVTDHSRANDRLRNIATEKSVAFPGSLDAKDQALYDRLSGLSGDAFDRAYMQAMLRDHVQDVAEFRRESKMAKDQDLRSFASNTLPNLEDDLRMAKETASKVSGETARNR
jgi:putative membrane protein